MGSRGEVFLARQPILDRRTRVVAHEILYRDAADSTRASVVDDSHASARVMLNAFGSLEDMLRGREFQVERFPA